MTLPFEEALNELIAKYNETDSDELISALELAIYALREQAEQKDDDE